MPELLTVFCALLGVVGLIFLTYYATKWLNKKFRNVGYNSSTNGIKIVECLGIAQDKQLIVIKVGCKFMLLGVTPSAVTKIADLDENDMSILETPPVQNGNTSFMESLKKVLHQKTNNTSDEYMYSDNPDFKQEDSYGENDKNDF